MRDLYSSLSSQRKNMSADLDAVKSSLVGLISEIELIRTVYGNDEIRSIMTKSEDARHQLDLIKPEVEAITQIFYELKSMLAIPKLDQQYMYTPEPTKQKTLPNPEYEQASMELGSLRSEIESTKSLYDREIRSTMAKSENAQAALKALNSEYESKMNDMQAVKSELLSLNSQRESLLKELDTVKSQVESTRSLNNSDEIQSIRREIDNVKTDLSNTREEKRKSEDELDNVRSQIISATKELTRIHLEVTKTMTELELKNRDISTAKRELHFIETELSMIHERDELRRLIKASSTLVADANSRYIEAKKELEVLQKILAEKNKTSENDINQNSSLR